ncbi:threonylcarbamoyl-AMP synthase [candidate division KSB3 bacterium]|uniref:L-threonylcarbamoyladenylate synthase n=1 Tax=candidate division KSB3 bacterium TaxID=2044937 RepID=A0A2G6E211_9BACT|nr:MAG: threonylcarbamoyl-AMP synthase [candidate division KSB3 bacterium]PIE28762.1 MAG: threonylcarbamoyl-AMP synthase [candidate division KSB3 bacterium]
MNCNALSQIPFIRRVTHSASDAQLLEEAAQILQQGGVLVCATDTGYLLGVDGLNVEAVKKVYAIKGRNFNKPIHVVVSDIEMARQLVVVDARAERLVQEFLPGPLTLILQKTSNVPELLVSGLPGLGIRIPENPFLLKLVKQAGCPMTATSANRSGRATPFSVDGVLQGLGKAVRYIDLIIDQQDTAHSMPSTILDLTAQPPRVLRQGPLEKALLRQYL